MTVKTKKIRRQDRQENDEIQNFHELPLSQTVPDAVNMDELGTYQDDDIVKRLDAMYEGRNAALKARESIVPWEIEICYVRREMQFRRERRQAHEIYTNQLEVDFKASQREERDLPVADLDNSKFMFLDN